MDILSQTLEVLQSQQKLTGDKEYLFYTRSVKRYFSHDTLVASFKRLLARNKIKERVLYNLRHTFASNMISEGYNILWVSKMLGHKDISITLNTYTKFIKEDQDKRLLNLDKMAQIWHMEQKNKALIFLKAFVYNGGRCVTRTRDPIITNDVLYQLS